MGQDIWDTRNSVCKMRGYKTTCKLGRSADVLDTYGTGFGAVRGESCRYGKSRALNTTPVLIRIGSSSPRTTLTARTGRESHRVQTLNSHIYLPYEDTQAQTPEVILAKVTRLLSKEARI